MYLSNRMLFLTNLPHLCSICRKESHMDYRMDLHKPKKPFDIIGLYTFYYYEHDKNFYFPGERHDFWEIVYVDRGEISVVAENSGHILKQGDIIFHKPNEFHTLGSTPREPHNVIVVTFETNSPAMDFFKNKIFTLNQGQRQILGIFLQEIRRAFAPGPDSAEIFRNPVADPPALWLAISHLEYLLVLLKREHTIASHAGNEYSKAKKNVENALVLSMKEYLQEHVCQQLSLQTICDHYNISKSYLCELFKNEVGKSVIDYHIDLKIAEAGYQIRKGERNITQIADYLGYNGIHQFSRSFRNKTGMSPTAYEKSIHHSV